MTSCPCKCGYVYGGLRMQAEPFAPWVHEAMGLCMPLRGLPDEKDWPNRCNANMYESGEHSVAWHTDDEKLFQ
eukprot:2828140-Pyramimonas_sp.AAC.1